jgi:hypothetical protein
VANNIKINGSIDLSVNANVESAKAQLMELQKSLK